MMEVTFAMDNAVGNSQRKRTYRACEPCKQKKKRCTHSAAFELENPKSSRQPNTTASKVRDATNRANTPGALASGSSVSNASQPHEGSDMSPHQRVTGESSATPTPDQELSGGDPVSQSHRFVGDLNPETVFYSQGNPRGGRDQESQNDVGMWVVRSKRSPKSPAHQTNDPVQNLQDKAQFHGDASNEQYLPPREDQSKLVNIYFSKIHPILPLLDESSFRQSFSDKSLPAVLMKALCLVASKDPSARPFLRFGNMPSTFSETQFARRIHADLCNCLNNKVERDKVVVIRCLALMSLHSEGSEGAELASWNLTQAVHHSQTIGLHHGREQGIKQDESLASLFWVLWSLDRLNAAINGRPVMLHDRDIGLDIETLIQSHAAPFQIWFRLAQQLDAVIALYRPAPSATVAALGVTLPSFEEIVAQCNGWDVQQSILASLETFYHAVSILSCRLRTINIHSDSNISYLRQCNSAQQIVSIMQLKLHSCLAPLPIIPYAVSLSLSVAYRQLRQTRLETTKELAKHQVEMCAKVLEELSSTWWSASSMAKLARKALLELDKAAQNSKRGKARGSQSTTQKLPSLVNGEQQTQAVPDHESVNQFGQEAVDQVQSSQAPRANHEPQSRPGNRHPTGTSGDVNDPLLQNIDNMQGGYPFEATLNPSYPEPDFIGNEAEIENIDAFLGNFLDLKSSRTNEDPSFMDYMDGLGQDYFNEIGASQPVVPSLNIGN